MYVFLCIYSGLSPFMESEESLKSLRSGQSTLGCGLGYHSKDYATLLMQLGICLMTKIDGSDITSGTGLTRNLKPVETIARAIFACMSCYMELRRYVYVILSSFLHSTVIQLPSCQK